MITKKCTGECQEVKPLSEFTPRKVSKDGYRNQCRSCVQEAQNARNAERRDVLNESARNRYRNRTAEQIERERERNRQFRQENADYMRETLYAWREANPDKLKAIRKRHYAKTAEQQIDRVNVRRGRYREGDMPDGYRDVLFEFYGECAQCGSTDDLTHDHVIPLSWPNGSHTFRNSQVLCGKHNSSKRNFHATDYRDSKQGILVGLFGNEPMVLRFRKNFIH